MLTCQTFAQMNITNDELTKMVAEDVAKPVRPIGVNGQESWNANAIWFIYPPTIVFQEDPNVANQYHHVVIDAENHVYHWGAKSPVVSLEEIWDKLAVGRVEVWCEAGSYASGHQRSRQYRCFWKMAPFKPGAYPKAQRSYREAEMLGYEYIYNLPFLQEFVKTGKPSDYILNCYPSKIHSAVVSAMVAYASLVPERREAALKMAKTVADYLLSISMPEGTPLEYFTPTYAGQELSAGDRLGQNMLLYPASVGMAFLELYGVLHDEKYLTAAKNIGKTYARLQGEDGTWYLMLNEKDGMPIGNNRLLPTGIVEFLYKLHEVTQDDVMKAVADRAFSFIDNGPLKDWNWEGQFEDQALTEKYVNLANSMPNRTIEILLNRWPNTPERIEQARELQRFVEDQFVCWEQPYKGMELPLYGTVCDPWLVEPAVVEQYHYRDVIDGSAAVTISALLALYRTTHNPLDLAKARALGDAMVRTQHDNGRLPTVWSKRFDTMAGHDWLNCFAEDLKVLHKLADFEE